MVNRAILSPHRTLRGALSVFDLIVVASRLTEPDSFMLPNNRSTAYHNRLCAITLIGLCIVFVFGVLAGHESTTVTVEAQTSTISLTRILPGSSARLELAAGNKQTIEIAMEQGKLLRVSIDKGDLVLSTVLYAPTGARVIEHISQELEIVDISFPGDAAGNYKLELTSREKSGDPRTLEITASSLMPVTIANKKDTEARQLMAAAAVLRAKWEESASKTALENYDRAAQIWTTISDFAGASHATLKAGDVCFC
jgi:hypothetical protein